MTQTDPHALARAHLTQLERVRGGMNSCLVEFTDGYKVVTSRNYIRRRSELPPAEAGGL